METTMEEYKQWLVTLDEGGIDDATKQAYDAALKHVRQVQRFETALVSAWKSLPVEQSGVFKLFTMCVLALFFNRNYVKVD